MPKLQLRDGRKIIGTLRSFDQFANLVLSGAVWPPVHAVAHALCSRCNLSLLWACCAVLLGVRKTSLQKMSLQTMPCPKPAPADSKERIIVGEQYAEIPLGLHVVRYAGAGW